MRRIRSGFTLVELLIVIAIIGIIIALILTAAMDGVRRAEDRATQALIIKLETALTDRIDALTNQRVVPTQAHHLMAQSVLAAGTVDSPQRAKVIAQYDFLKSQLPDVFFVQNKAPANAGDYPLNFAAQAFNPSGTLAKDWTDYYLPMGAPLNYVQPTGIYGAAFEIAAGVYKNLGYAPQGFDGVDNNGDGIIDDYTEGITGLSSGDVAAITTRLSKHTHATARAEMLYAILVEGGGPLGSAFQPDDFTNKEVQDTDGDGLPEFVDAWGEPLQFFRWPIYYHSDLQKGFWAGSTGNGPYDSVFQAREQDPIDPNQTLVAPAWWSSSFNTASGGNATTGSSGKAVSFEHYFHSLTEPLVTCGNITAPAPAYLWDRSSSTTPVSLFARRAFFSKFLILSGGPDKNPGVFLCDVDYQGLHYDFVQKPDGATVPSIVSGNLAQSVTNLLLEGYAMQADMNLPSNALANTLTAFLVDAAGDDVTNHNINAAGGAIK